MKRLLIVYLLSFLTPAFVAAQDTTSFVMPRAVVKLSPLHFINNTFEMGIEVFNANFTRSFNLDIGFRSGALDYVKGDGFNAEIGFRRYVAPMSLHTRKNHQFYQGIYYGFFVRGETFYGEPYDYSGSSTQTESRRVNTLAPGFLLGLQKTLWQIIFLDVYFGGGIKLSDYEPDSDDFYYEPGLMQPGYEGIYPKIGAKIGMRL